VRSVKNIRLSHPLLSVVLATGPAPEPEPAEAMVPISLVEEARKAGYQGGFEAASAAIEAQLVEQRAEVTHLQQKVFAALTSHHDSLTRQVRSAVPELAMEAVRRVIAGVEPDQASVERIVAEMLQEITPGPELIEVCLSARDLALVESYQPTLRERYPQIQFRADPDLRPGDCVVNSRFGSLDGRLATKLRSIQRLLQ
jgi:flagellar assembly protein FliH